MLIDYVNAFLVGDFPSIRYAESLIILPLKKNELVGIFMLFDTKPRSFIIEEITFLEAMSSQIGNAIEKASL